MRAIPVSLCASLLLSGCVFAGDTGKWPTLAIEPEKPVAAPPAAAPSEGSAAPAERAREAASRVESDIAASEARLARHRQDVDWARQSVADQRQRFMSALARLTAGDANPERGGDLWSSAQVELTRLASSIADMSLTEMRLAEDAARLARILAVLKRSLAAQTAADPPTYALLARTETALAAIGDLLDGFESAREEAERFAAEQQALLNTGDHGPASEYGLPKDRKPFIVIPAAGAPSPRLEEQISAAAEKAMRRYPEVSFDIFAVRPPSGGGFAEKHAWETRRVLRKLGIAEKRITVTYVAGGSETGEVRIYVR